MHMKKKISILAIGLAMVSVVLPSCSWEIGKGDLRDRNLEKATLSYLACEDEVEYVGLSDPHDLEDNKLQVVVIYYYTDSLGNKLERNARVTTNNDCSQIYSWHDLDCRIIDSVKQRVNKKLEEKGIPSDGSLIDALVELKKQIR